ncbi:hypothetical protein CK203_097113 [Vitis vinifera]|uniref:Reverse transcriptase/retrotransposon-derived protein RNase H-like domain-containing protein n=1 Tax=Vitis vinifera TaxID=29760 RepID=A0A438BPM0_VITVI|nr:hypothetical protein CK203_097113 [Vitis vinifera]
MRELEALRQRSEESVTSFISHWREKISHIIDLPSENEQISMIMRSLQPKETSYVIPSTPSPTDYYLFCTETDTIVLPTRYAFEQSFPEAHGGWLVDQLAPRPVPQPVPPRFRMDLHLPPPLGDIHHINLIEDDSIHMLSWDDRLPEPIVLHGSCEVDGVSLGLKDTTISFTLWPKNDDSYGRKIQIITRSGRIAQPPPAIRPFEGTASHKEVRRKDDEIKVKTTTTPEGLIHMMTASRATYIVFSDDYLSPEGSDHICPLYITVDCLGHRVSSILLDNGSALNVCHLATAIALGFSPSDFSPSTQTIRAYDSTKREVMGTLVIDLHISPTTFSTLFQKVKFIHDGQVITGPSEFIAAIDHDTIFGLGFIPTESDYRYMGSDTSIPMEITHPSLDRASLLSLCFLEEINDDGVVIDPTEIIDGVVSHDEYQDEMDMMTVSQITSIVQLQPISPFDMFGMSTSYAIWVEERRSHLSEGSTTLFHDMMHRDVEVYIEAESQEVHFGVTSGNCWAYGHERGIEVDPDKIKAILDMPAETEKEIRGFLGRLQYIQSFHSQIDRHIAFARTSTSSIFVSFRHGLGITSLGYQEIEALHDRIDEMALLLTEFDIQMVLYFDGAANQSGYGIGVLLVSPQVIIFRDSFHLAFSDRHPITNNIVEAQNRFSDALATLASSVTFRLMCYMSLIELRSAPAYYCLIGETKVQDDLPWYHDIYQFLRSGTYPEAISDGMLLLCLDRASADDDEREMPKCQIHGDLIHAPPSELHALTRHGHFQLFHQVGGGASYARLTSASCQFHQVTHHLSLWVPHELILDRGCTSESGATPYSLVYGMKVVLPVEIEMGSLRVTLEQQISEIEWAQARFDQLNLLDERRLRAVDHVQAYQRKMARAFRKRLSLNHYRKRIWF